MKLFLWRKVLKSLRKDSLPSGSMHRIADELGLNVDTVRNFFGGHNFKEGKSVGIHLEPGPKEPIIAMVQVKIPSNPIAPLSYSQIVSASIPKDASRITMFVNER